MIAPANLALPQPPCLFRVTVQIRNRGPEGLGNLISLVRKKCLRRSQHTSDRSIWGNRDIFLSRILRQEAKVGWVASNKLGLEFFQLFYVQAHIPLAHVERRKQQLVPVRVVFPSSPFLKTRDLPAPKSSNRIPEAIPGPVVVPPFKC